MSTNEKTNLGIEKYGGMSKRGCARLEILGCFLESYAPPSDNGLTARRQRRVREQRGCEVFWRGFCWCIDFGKDQVLDKGRVRCSNWMYELVMICGSWEYECNELKERKMSLWYSKGCS
ncbi:hypothetical protein DEO72_LG8g1075 [Vigna unguiculata]|uniref:Uncharacterized protein n=1 Tax=Vigna unguiculata TaxID=3917 RepID=A0A4D6MNJ4_VIGUN|nr:hypothetical protein DEO72_LG8g1075 [Vigna unguiculata]